MKLNIGGINIDILKQAAGLMGMTFEEYLEKAGMKAIIETAESEQSKIAEKEKAEREKEEFESLKLDIEAFKSQTENEIERIKSQIQDDFRTYFREEQRSKIDLKIDFTFKINVKGAKREGGTRTSNGQSTWRLFVDDIEIDGVPEGSEFTTNVENAKNKWNWIAYEICKVKRPNDIPTMIFGNRISLAGVAALYKPKGTRTQEWDWKAAARDGRLAARMSTELEKRIRIEEVEKAA